MALTKDDLQAIRDLMRVEIRGEIRDAFQRYEEDVAKPHRDQVLTHIDGLAKMVKDQDEEFEVLKSRVRVLEEKTTN